MPDAPPRDSRPLKPPPLLAAGQVVAGYEVQRLVGKGGMGEVYRARQLSMDREVALKILSPRLAKSDPSFAKRFVDEARAAGKLNHPNIIHVHDVGTAALPGDRGSVHFFSMEFIDGESVQEILNRDGRLAPAQVAQVMTGVAAALAYAEKAGIVHRDIKPDNVMITTAGLVKVADLGLATPSQTGEDHAPERDEQGRAKVMGTPLYLSPEQARALPVDHRSDQYSLGATLFHMLTGEPPYRGPDAKSIMKSHVVDPVPDPVDRDEGVDEAWRQLAMRLMQKKPEERFSTEGELVRAVEAAAAGVTLEELARRQQAFVFRLPSLSSPWVLIGGGTLFVLIVFWLLLAHGRGHDETPPVPTPAPVAPVPAPKPAPVPAPAPVAPVAPPRPTVDVSGIDDALTAGRLGEAAQALAALDPQAPEVAAAAKRLAAASGEHRRDLGARVAASPAAGLPALAAEGQALPPADQAWLAGVIAARRTALATAKPTDDDRWRDLAHQLDRLRIGVGYEQVKPLVERLGPTFEDTAARQQVAKLADLGVLGQKGEGVLRAYLKVAQPHVTVVLDGKEIEVVIKNLSRSEVAYVAQGGDQPAEEQKSLRSKIGMPWSDLLDDALKDQAADDAPQVRAATLWMWALPEAIQAFAALGDQQLATAIDELEKHRK